MNKIANVLPYLLSVFTVTNTVTQHKLGLAIYNGLAVLGVGVAFLISTNLGGLTSRNSIGRPFLLLLGWLALVFVGETITSSLWGEVTLAFKTLFHLLWAPLFWILFTRREIGFNWQRFLVFNLVIGVGVAVLGFVQRQYSLTLFGFIPDVKWQDHFQANSGQFRVTSVLSSPQVFGLYCTIFAIVAFSRLSWPTSVRFVLAGLFIAAAFLSGNKGVVALLIIFILFRIKTSANGIVIPIAGTLLVLILLLFSTSAARSSNLGDVGDSAWTRSYAWLLNLPEFLERERQGRLLIYRSIIEESNIVVGSGMGCTAPDEGERGIVPESHLLLLYSEAGLPAVLFFIAFLWACGKAAKKRGEDRQVLIIGLVAAASAFVHAIAYPAFFSVWGIVIGQLKLKESQESE